MRQKIPLINPCWPGIRNTHKISGVLLQKWKPLDMTGAAVSQCQEADIQNQ